MTDWQKHSIAYGLLIAAILAMFGQDVIQMVGQWWLSSTYQHCLFIFPIVAWLVYQRRRQLTCVEPMAWAPGLLPLALGSFLWLLGEAAGAAVVRQAALILMIQSAALALLGPAVVRLLVFPLFYLVFSIPLGDDLIPSLQLLTARLAICLLHLSGIQATLSGVFITTSKGWFEVAEACSGAKFLIAMIALGTLAANLCFSSWYRRTLFMCVCVVLPVLANSWRAAATIYVAQVTSVAAATGLDHIIYGWFFFAAVVAAIFALSWRYFDRSPHEIPTIAEGGRWKKRPVTPVVLLALLVPAASDAWARVPRQAAALEHRVVLPEVPGWMPVPPGRPPWVPRFDGADHRLYGAYRNGRGETVDLAIALYADQGEGREIVGFGQGVVSAGGPWLWTSDGPRIPGAKTDRLSAPGKQERDAVTFYVIGGGVTGSAIFVKLQTALNKLFHRDPRAAVVIISAPLPPGRTAIASFLGGLGPPDVLAARLLAAASGT